MSEPPRLWRLIYRSRQSASVGADLEYQVGDIVRRSIHNNRLADISGLLLTIQGHFLQVLEGQPQRLEETYRRIAGDPRHLELEVISSEPAESRLFREWEMCARAISPSDALIVESLDQRGRFDPTRLTPRSALRLVGAVAQMQRQASLKTAIW